MKPDLIILHGALGSKAQFSSIIELLQLSFNVHVFDFVGHGSEPMAASFGIESFADQLDAYIDSNKLSQPSVFGYSMGGYVALFLEAKRPGTLGKIFTLATKYDWTPESSKREASYLNVDVMQEKVPRFLEYLKKLHGDQWENTVNQTREMMLRMGNAPELDSEVLSKVNVECLISVGDLDKMVSIEETKRLASPIAQSRFELWPETEHPFEKVNVNVLSEQITMFFTD